MGKFFRVGERSEEQGGSSDRAVWSLRLKELKGVPFSKALPFMVRRRKGNAKLCCTFRSARSLRGICVCRVRGGRRGGGGAGGGGWGGGKKMFVASGRGR